MSSDWPLVRLEEITSVLGDGLHGTPIYDDEGSYHFINGNNLLEGRIVVNEKTKRVSEAEAQKHRKNLNERTILVSINGTLGNIAFYCGEKVVLGKSACYFNVDVGVDKHFVRYVLQSETFQSYIHNLATGSTIKNVSLRLMRNFSFQLPNLEVQKRISAVLKALDDRITLLRETNATLEAIAQALFKSWFVDFDPVRAKAEGRQPEGMNATTAALFPDSFKESELGLVPKEWSIGCVSDLASQKKGSVNPSASPEVLFEHYSLPAFDSGQAPVFELGQEIKSNKTPLPEEAVLLSKLNPHIPRVWLPVRHGPNAVCSTEFLAYSPRGGAPKELIYCLFSSEEFQQKLCQLVTGTSNSHQRVKPDQVLAVKLPIADKPALKAFTEIVRPLFDRVHAGRLQAQTLTQLRNTLLPRLISGQLRLPEAEHAVEAALA